MVVLALLEVLADLDSQTHFYSGLGLERFFCTGSLSSKTVMNISWKFLNIMD
jgi:hypothetical protein